MKWIKKSDLWYTKLFTIKLFFDNIVILIITKFLNLIMSNWNSVSHFNIIILIIIKYYYILLYIIILFCSTCCSV